MKEKGDPMDRFMDRPTGRLMDRLTGGLKVKPMGQAYRRAYKPSQWSDLWAGPSLK